MTETNEQYHARNDISASMLKDMNRSWRIYEATWLTNQIKREPSASMELGTAIHAAVLEPERFHCEYVTVPQGVDHRRNTNSYKDWRKQIDADVNVISRSDLETVVRCRDALHKHPIIKPFLEAEGRCEVSHYWTCPETDVPCKFRPDKVIPHGQCVFDIKTTQSVDGFDKAVADFGYHLQAAHYIRGAEHRYGGEDWIFLFAVVETNPPYRCRAISLDSESLGIGFDTRERLLSEYVRRLNNDDWSDPDEGELVTVSLPSWFLKKANV